MFFVYRCIVIMCLSSGFWRVFILFSNIVVQSGLRILINWCSHVFIFGLIVVINANNILGIGCCLLCFIYCAKCGRFLIALG